MKKIELDEQKKILVEILDYIHKICIKNNINYSLIGGSLIGAIRHQGIIPWDDDIDIILVHDEYMKLIEVLKNQQSQYKLLYVDSKNYLYPFAKLIDTRTVLKEKKFTDIDDYGVYVDIFEYNNFPNNNILGVIHYKKMMFYKILMGRCSLIKNDGNLLKKAVGIFAKQLGIKKIINKYNKVNWQYNKKNCDRYLSNWPAYGLKKEVQNKEWFNKYKIVKFENIEAMITEDYDNVLKTTFGDYMQLPPEEQRVTHHDTDVYWKE
mgnify:CR=1 FL=1